MGFANEAGAANQPRRLEMIKSGATASVRAGSPQFVRCAEFVTVLNRALSAWPRSAPIDAS